MNMDRNTVSSSHASNTLAAATASARVVIAFVVLPRYR
jgi:hypothetical protein